MKKLINFIIVTLIIFNTQNCVFASEDEIIEFYYTRNELNDISDENFDDFGSVTHAIKKEFDTCNFFRSNGINKINCYVFDLEVFKEFLKTPTKEFLEHSFEMELNKAAVFELMEIPNFPDKMSEEQIDAKLLNDSDLYVYYDLFDPGYDNPTYFFTKKNLQFINEENLQKVLTEKGINEKIIDRAVIVSYYYPVLVWIKTENNCYFWVFNKLINKDGRTIFILDEKNITDGYITEYSLYNYDEFIEKYAECSGDIIANNTMIEGENNVYFYGNNFVVKTRGLLEALGAKNIIWNQEKRSVTFNIGEDKIEYFLKTDYNRIYYTEAGNKYSTPYFINSMPSLDSAWWNNIPFFKENSLYYNLDYLNLLFEKYNKKYSLDAENRVLIVEDIN